MRCAREVDGGGRQRGRQQIVVRDDMEIVNEIFVNDLQFLTPRCRKSTLEGVDN